VPGLAASVSETSQVAEEDIGRCRSTAVGPRLPPLAISSDDCHGTRGHSARSVTSLASVIQTVVTPAWQRRAPHLLLHRAVHHAELVWI
jgi:hypothetical protein